MPLTPAMWGFPMLTWCRFVSQQTSQQQPSNSNGFSNIWPRVSKQKKEVSEQTAHRKLLVICGVIPPLKAASAELKYPAFRAFEVRKSDIKP